MSKVVIETSQLVKRYPTSLRTNRDRGPRGSRGSVGGYRELFNRKKNFIQALNKVDLKVYGGEIFGLLGPNGAGKTTLIKILCTLVLPDGGEAHVNGYDVVKEPCNVLRNLQAVLGETRGFDWRLNARQSLEFYAALYGLPKESARKRVDELLDFTRLTDRASDMYQRFSTGMARKLQLCRALLLDTPIILFDEPTKGLDPTSAADFRRLLKDKLARSEQRTILITTHNMWEAQSICDRVAIMNKGEIIACETPENLRRYIKPEKSYVLVFNENGRKTEASNSLKDFMTEIEDLKGYKESKVEFGQPTRVTVRLDRETEVSDLLKLVVKYGFKIKDLKSYETSLEEAFIALVRKENSK